MVEILDQALKDPTSAASNVILNCPVYLPPATAQALPMDVSSEFASQRGPVPSSVSETEIADNPVPISIVAAQPVPDSTGLSGDSQSPVESPILSAQEAEPPFQ